MASTPVTKTVVTYCGHETNSLWYRYLQQLWWSEQWQQQGLGECVYDYISVCACGPEPPRASASPSREPGASGPQESGPPDAPAVPRPSHLPPAPAIQEIRPPPPAPRASMEPETNGTWCWAWGNASWEQGEAGEDCWVPMGQWEGPEVVLVPILFGLFFLLGLSGNMLVLLVLWRAKVPGPRSPTNIFILNLSVADCSFLLFCVPFQATVYSLPEWVFGAFLCKWVHYCVMVSMLVSVFTLVAMSVDRYVAIVHARRSLCIRSRRNAALGVATAWLLAVAVAVPTAQHQVLVSGQHQAPNRSFCWEHWGAGHTSAKHAYKIVILLLGYLLPLMLITYCYAKVLFHLHKKVKNVSKKSERSKKKTAQTILLVVAVFLVSWMPHHIIIMWAEFGNFPLTSTSFTFRIISHCLAYSNSCINPILYAFLSENFRRSCRQVCPGRCLLKPAREDKRVRIRMDNISVTRSTTNM
ncbi:galanin receptor type 1-like [Ornithorhynchus anatinus]|nr:galanin receptor type 1-like [Ornithorhynchus anatinus]